jgi:hypothetical protein
VKVFVRLKTALRRRFGDYARTERAALADGTRVRLLCDHDHHKGVWRTSWTPRRLNDVEAPDDYQLTRESDGKTTYATRGAIEPC